MKLLSQFLKQPSVKSLSKHIQVLLVDKYVTYTFGVITLAIVSETFRNSDQTLLKLLKDVSNFLVVKVAIILLALYVGYYNQVFGILILVNLFFITNLKEKLEFFADKIPNLIDKNKALKYDKYIKSPHQKSKSKTTSKPKTDDTSKSPRVPEKENISDQISSDKKKISNDIQNPIQIAASRKLKGETEDNKYEKEVEEEVEKMTQQIENDDIVSEDLESEIDDSQKDSKKKKIYMNYYENNDKLKKKELDDIGFPERGSKSILEKRSLNEFTDRKKKKKKIKEELIDELKKVEAEQIESDRLTESKDKTIESRIENSNYEKRRNLKILEDQDDDESSSSSDSSDSSSSESSSESDRDYEDVSLTEAREHVLKKLRNKMKKDYVHNK